MDKELKERFFSTMMCFRKLESAFSVECEMQMNEMAILHNITGNCSCQECTCMNLDVPKMQEKLQDLQTCCLLYTQRFGEEKLYCPGN